MIQDIEFMKLAITEALKGYGKVTPNPMVGALVVKDGVILSMGYHHQSGQDHAEVDALKKLTDEEISGATIYVTLEPCCHLNKKTPPCTNLLIEKKIKRIVICNLDPNPCVNGKGIKILESAGIQVDYNILKEEGEKLNKIFFKFIKTKRPYVHLKFAQTLDGKIAAISGDSKWISDETARKEVHQLRLGYDAILVGKNTVNSDDPSLTIRYGYESIKDCPYRTIVGDLIGMNLNSKIFNDEFISKTIIICRETKENRALVPFFIEKGIIVEFAESVDGKIATKRLLEILAAKNITSVLVEGGSQIISQFLIERNVDQVTSYIAPKIIGSGKGFFSHSGFLNMADAITFKNPNFRAINNQMVMDAEGVIA